MKYWIAFQNTSWLPLHSLDMRKVMWPFLRVQSSRTFHRNASTSTSISWSVLHRKRICCCIDFSRIFIGISDYDNALFTCDILTHTKRKREEDAWRGFFIIFISFTMSLVVSLRCRDPIFCYIYHFSFHRLLKALTLWQFTCKRLEKELNPFPCGGSPATSTESGFPAESCLNQRRATG